MATQSSKGERPAPIEDATSSARPVAVFRSGNVSAAVFRETVSGDAGVNFFARISLRRAYRVSNEWKHTHTLQRSDLLDAAYALTRAYEFLTDSDESEE